MNAEKIRASLEQIEGLVADCLRAIGDQTPPDRTKRKMRPQSGVPMTSHKPDLNLPFRPFMHRYGGSMSGSQKFTLILAHLVKGNLKAEAKLDVVIKALGQDEGLARKL
jgi:hypothetical protein